MQMLIVVDMCRDQFIMGDVPFKARLFFVSFSGLLLACEKFQLSFWDLFGFETQVKLKHVILIFFFFSAVAISYNLNITSINWQ